MRHLPVSDTVRQAAAWKQAADETGSPAAAVSWCQTRFESRGEAVTVTPEDTV
jgi:hypothetical protein